jgi:sigma-B regulation protein RsbU (phosphoserine phosphatase)
MANVQAQLRALLEHTNWTLEGLAHELNRKVMSLVKGDRFVTLFMGYFHRPTRRLQYLNAGHNPPVLYSNGEIHYLKEGTVGIGMLHDLPFINHGEIKLGYDAAIVAYTDGIIETENDAQEEFGYERLGHCLERYSKHDSLIETLVTDIVQAAEAHRSSNPYTDDITLLCCRFR